MKYCTNCKFYRHIAWLTYPGSYPPPNHICLRFTTMYLNPVREHIYEKIEDCLIRNQKLNCEYYQRTWYKFWIKGDK